MHITEHTHTHIHSSFKITQAGSRGGRQNTHTCTHTVIYTYMHAYMHTYIHTYMHAYIHTHIQVADRPTEHQTQTHPVRQIHTHTHNIYTPILGRHIHTKPGSPYTYIMAYTRACTHTDIQAASQSYIHTRRESVIHTQSNIQKYIYTHT